MNKEWFFVSFLLMAPYMAIGQLTLDAAIRPRAELRNGYKNTQAIPGEYPEFVVTQRTGLGMHYKSIIAGYLHFQDVRTWGDAPVKQDVPGVLLKEGWLHIPIAGKFSTKVGRQILKYDDQRILAATNWNQVGTQHDVVLMKYVSDKIDVHVGAAYNNEEPSDDFEAHYPLPHYKAMFLGWCQYRFNDRLWVSVLVVSDWHAKDSTKHTYHKRFTGGGSFRYETPTGIKLNGTAYLQGGQSPSGQRINAYMATLKVVYSATTKHDWFVGVDAFSGKDPNQPGEYQKVFNRLYGARHKYLGYMDYFPESNHGILDLNGGLYWQINEKAKLEFAVHAFWLPHDYTLPEPPNEKISQYLGTEFDLQIQHKVTDDLHISFIQSMMLGTHSLDIVKGGSHSEFSSFAMFMLSWKPVFTIR